MKTIEIKEKTLDKAIELACQKLKVSKDKLNVKILEEKKSKFFIMGETFVKILASIKEPEFKKNEEHHFNHISNLDLEKSTKILKTLLEKMGFDLNVTSSIKEDTIYFFIDGNDKKYIIGKFGETLDALEEVVSLMIARLEKGRKKIKIDVDDYRREKEDKLKEILLSIAREIREKGNSKKMRKLTSKERKFVHEFFEKYDDIETQSFGVGDDRYILISKKNNRRAKHEDNN